MKKKRYAISWGNKKRRLPVIPFLAVWLLMDRLKSPQWLWGIYWFISGTVFLAFLYDCYNTNEVQVDLDRVLKREEAYAQDEKYEQEIKNAAKNNIEQAVKKPTN